MGWHGQKQAEIDRLRQTLVASGTALLNLGIPARMVQVEMANVLRKACEELGLGTFKLRFLFGNEQTDFEAGRQQAREILGGKL